MRDRQWRWRGRRKKKNNLKRRKRRGRVIGGKGEEGQERGWGGKSIHWWNDSLWAAR